MSDLRTAMTILEDVSSQAGRPLHAAVENNPAAGKNAHPALVCIDALGNLRYAKVNAAGELVVSTESVEKACLTAEGNNAGSATFVDLAVITLQNDLNYSKLGFMGSSFRDSVFEVVWVDDVGGTPVETVLATFRVGAGHLNHSEELECIAFTAGSVGTQELRIRGKNNNALSDMDGMISIEEDQT